MEEPVKARVAAIVPSAGSGRRLGLATRKPFVLLGGRPLVLHTLRALEACRAVDAIYIAAEDACVSRFKKLIAGAGLRKVAAVVVGGRTRAESVRNCLALLDRSYGIVLIHDAARPFIDSATITASVRMAARYGGCIVAVPENDTIKEAGKDLVIRRTLDRSRIYRAQTPQVFRRDLIDKAYGLLARKKSVVTDDSSLVEMLGEKVRILEGSYCNIKITTKADLQIAEALVKHGRAL